VGRQGLRLGVRRGGGFWQDRLCTRANAQAGSATDDVIELELLDGYVVGDVCGEPAADLAVNPSEGGAADLGPATGVDEQPHQRVKREVDEHGAILL
jgi:hypothetical protein